MIEFKAAHTKKGETLEEAVKSALEQIGKKKYAEELRRRGIPAGQIRKYGFAFEGKNVLIDGG